MVLYQDTDKLLVRFGKYRLVKYSSIEANIRDIANRCNVEPFILE